MEVFSRRRVSSWKVIAEWAALPVVLGALMGYANAPGWANRWASGAGLATLATVVVGVPVGAWVYDGRRRTLSLDGGRIASRGPFGSFEVDLATATRATWPHAANSGELDVRSPSGNLGVNFAHYDPGDVEAMVAQVRAALRPEIQEGWARFATARERDRLIAAGGLPPGWVRLSRRRWDWIFGIGIGATGVANALLWRLLQSPVGLGYLAMLIVLWLLMREQGREVVGPALTRDDAAKILRLVAWFLGLGFLAVFLDRLDHRSGVSRVLAVFGLIAYMAAPLVALFFSERSRRRRPPPAGGPESGEIAH